MLFGNMVYGHMCNGKMIVKILKRKKVRLVNIKIGDLVLLQFFASHCF